MTNPRLTLPDQGNVLHAPGGDVYIPKLTAADTGNTLSAAVHTVSPGAGTPLHVHAHEDETFWIIDGDITFWVGPREGGKAMNAPKGSVVFGPRRVPHCFANTTQRPASLLIIVTPPLNFERFYEAVGAPAEGGLKPTDEEMIRRIVTAAPGHGIEILGPNPVLPH